MLRLIRTLAVRGVRRMSPVVLSAFVGDILASPLWAQGGEFEERQPRYVISYVLIFLLLGLSIFGICRPSRRAR